MQRNKLWFVALVTLFMASARAQNTFPASGNVGIGTTTPTQALTVNGNIIGSALYLRSDAVGNPDRNVNISPSLLYEGMISGNGTTPTPWGLNLSASPWTWGQDPITYHGGFHEFRVAGGNTNEKAVMDINGGGIVLLNGSTLIFPDGSTQTTAYTGGSGYLYLPGNTNPTTSNQGAYLGWNVLTGGTGETDFINNQGGGSGGFAFMNTSGNGASRNTLMFISGNGNVGIGTTNPQYKLSVNGTIQAKEVLVNTGWADYVFQPGYRVRPLTEVAAFIKANHHLPDIPSETEIKDKGVSLGDMQTKLLAKIEELTLQMIQLDEKNRALAKKVAQLEGR